MITIPNNLKKIIQADHINALAMLDNIDPNNPPELSLNECLEFYKAKLFIDKLKLECWEFCSQLWEKVWKETLNNLPSLKETNINYIKSPYLAFRFWENVKFSEKKKAPNASIFTVAYFLNKRKNINFCIKIDWAEKRIGTYCSFDNNKAVESEVIPTETEFNFVKKDEDNDKSNQSKYQISLMQEEINDNEINELKKAAMEIINHINKESLISKRN